MTTSIVTKTRTADSTDRTAILPGAKVAAVRPKTTAARVGGAARRLLNALMRSLANPHV